MDKFRAYRVWFKVAAIYNTAFGIAAVLFPSEILSAVGILDAKPLALFQCIGMLVGVYALGYWLVAVDPARYGAFATIGLVGKILGPIGLAWAALDGQLPWSFGWINLLNDVIWLPVFICFVMLHRKQEATDGRNGSGL